MCISVALLLALAENINVNKIMENIVKQRCVRAHTHTYTYARMHAPHTAHSHTHHIHMHVRACTHTRTRAAEGTEIKETILV